MEEAAARRSSSREASLTAEQIRLRSERQSLELSCARVLKDLETATHERRRKQLRAALDYLQRKLSELNLQQ